MTDREKLQKAIEILETHGFLGSIEEFKGYRQAIETLYYHIYTAPYFAWQPTGRACFDKPAGTPIRHEETL